MSGIGGSIGGRLPGHCRFDKFSFHFGVDSAGEPVEAVVAADLENLNTVGFEQKASRGAPLWYIIGQRSNIKLAYV